MSGVKGKNVVAIRFDVEADEALKLAAEHLGVSVNRLVNAFAWGVAETGKLQWKDGYPVLNLYGMQFDFNPVKTEPPRCNE